MAVAAFGFLSLVCCFCFVVLQVWMAWRLTDSVALGVLSGAVAAYLVWRGLLSSQRMHADRASGDEVVRR